MTLDDFFDKYPEILKKYDTDSIVRSAIENYTKEHTKWNLDEAELLYRIFISAEIVRELLDKKLKEYIDNMAYPVKNTNGKVNGSR